MAATADQQRLDEQLAKLRQDPNVRVYRRSTTQPFTPVLRVTGPVTARELLARDDPDEADAPTSR